MRKDLSIAVAVIILGLSLALVAPAQCQTAINPSTVEFTASADHNATLGGTPILTRYELRIYLQGAAQPFSIQDLGKPTPDANNKIALTNRSWFIALAMNLTHVAKVAAIGPAGEAVSENSNFFGNAGPPAAAGVPVIR